MTPGADHSFAAVLCGRDAIEEAEAPDVSERIAALCRHGVHVAVAGRRWDAGHDDHLRLHPAGPGTLHLLVAGDAVYARAAQGDIRVACVGADLPAMTAWLAAWLADRGIGGGLVVIVGAALTEVIRRDTAGAVDLGRATVVGVRERCGGPDRSAGPERHAREAAPSPTPGSGTEHTLLDVLDAQVRRRAAGRVPDIDHDPAWVLALPSPTHPVDIAVQETLLTLADGRFGTRGSLEERDGGAVAAVVAAGVYTDDGDRRRLLGAPDWTRIDHPASAGGRRLLDLRTGVVWRETRDGVRTLRFSSCARSGVMGLRVEAPNEDLAPGAALRPCDRTSAGGCVTVTHSTRGGGIAAAARQRRRTDGPTATVERLAAYVADPGRVPDVAAADRLCARSDAAGFEPLLTEHRAAWARRWADATVRIDGAAADQLAVRFALFHLLSVAAGEDEAAVGARGLSGPSYDGHVFWDADVFVLPVLTATRPAAARAMLQYRVSRLPAARERARANGFAGALWPWESADDGRDVTPATAPDRQGVSFPVRTAEAEHHIVAAVAWAVSHYARWTGDRDFLHGPGLPLVLDGARFWVSRARHDRHGRAHIDDVVGPDEYHELVDDNAYTNVMARWNLRRAADLACEHGGADADEIAQWCAVADALVDGYDEHTGTHEQFAGFSRLTPLAIGEIAAPPVAADLLLGRRTVQSSQVVKQADVVMLHHLVPDDMPVGSLVRDLERYAPHTAHGSSLSPAVHAAVWARARQPDRALRMFHVAARLDLDDLTGTTAAGLHIATMGGV